MIKNGLRMLVGGEAGDGVFAASDTMALTFSRSGLEVFTTQRYSSRIRGGHIHTKVRVDEKRIGCEADGLDFLFAMDQETVELHRSKLVPGGILLYDNSSGELKGDDLTDRGVKLFGVPARKLAKDVLDSQVMKNTILIGAAFALLSFDTDFETLGGILAERFAKKGQVVVDKNVAAAKLGLDKIKAQLNGSPGYKLERVKKEPRMLITGNEAIALGALVAGCRFVSGYPITPATDVLEYLASHLPRYNGVVVQSEDEMSAINMAIGAGFSGVRSMTCTSGPGLSLMVEALGLAAITETPVVIIDVQRVGPSTGMPTRTEQGDLNLLIFGAHGDAPRIVLAPSDLEECFYMTIRAFNLAEKYQMPVLIASDQYLSQGNRTVPIFDTSRININREGLLTEEEIKGFEKFQRYADTETGISPRSIPMQRGGIYKATGVMHLEGGHATEKPEIRIKMMDKLFRKMKVARQELEAPQIHGREDARLTIVSWGSTKGAILEVLERLWAEGVDVKLMHITDIWPFPEERVAEVLSSSSLNICVENNYSGQLAGLIKRQTGLDTIKILSYGGDPITPDNLHNAIKELVEEYSDVIDVPYTEVLRVL